MAISLRKLARAHRLRQRELAEIIKTDQSVVSLIINGHRKLSEDHIELLRAKYGDAELSKFVVENEEVLRKSAELTFYDPELVADVNDAISERLSSVLNELLLKMDHQNDLLNEQNELLKQILNK